MKVSIRVLCQVLCVTIVSILTLSACGNKDSTPAPVASPIQSPNDDILVPVEQPAGPVPSGPIAVHIFAINRITALDHPRLIYVHPGDVVQIAADSYVDGSAQNTTLSSFSWSADSDGGAVCNAANEETCSNTSFLLDAQGVSFVVPDNVVSQTNIRVYLTSDPSTYDTLVLQRLSRNNLRFDPRFNEFPHWNPAWNANRHGRWDRSWDRGWDRNR